MKHSKKILSVAFFFVVALFLGLLPASAFGPAGIPGLSISMKDMVYSPGGTMSFVVDFLGAPSSLAIAENGSIYSPNAICFLPVIDGQQVSPVFVLLGWWSSWTGYTISNAAQFCQSLPASGSGSQSVSFGPVPIAATSVGVRVWMLYGFNQAFSYDAYYPGSIYGTTVTWPVVSNPVLYAPTGWYPPANMQEFASVPISSVPTPPIPIPPTVSISATPVTVTTSPQIDFPVGTSPYGATLDSATNSIWVTNYGSNNVTKLDASSGALIGTYPVGNGPKNAAFDPSTNSIWVANYNSGSVTKLDVYTGATVGTYIVGSTPIGVVFDSSTNSMWITNYGSNNVTKLNASSGALIGTYPVGARPRSIIFDQTDNTIWVANIGFSNIMKLDAATGSVLNTYPTGSTPYDIALDKITNSIWITNDMSNTVSKMSLIDGTRVNYPVGETPRGIAFDATTNSVWVTNYFDETVSKVDINAGTKVNFATKVIPRGVVFDPATASVWVVNQASNVIRRISVNPNPASTPILSWSVAGVSTSCTASGSWGGAKSRPNGSQYVNTLATPGTYTYTLNCYNGVSLGTASATVVATANTATAPTVTGPISLGTGANGTYTFTATDPQGDQIRYGVDWDMNGVADEWLPAGVTYVNSGTPQSTTHSWVTPGAKTFQALTQDFQGLNSAWTVYNVTVATPSCGNGAIDPPTCNTCAGGYSMYLAICYANCVNGATNPPLCNLCPSGQSFAAGVCVASCANGTTNPPTCTTCPAGKALIAGICAATSVCPNAICETGETPVTCPKDCKIKYKQF